MRDLTAQLLSVLPTGLQDPLNPPLHLRFQILGRRPITTDPRDCRFHHIGQHIPADRGDRSDSRRRDARFGSQQWAEGARRQYADHHR
ncbi:hypothetical protein [Actinomadura rubrisoli]|uniref:Uncharacterized protein n=1 Tax=Actinomadura rubrisoli TaxID=2530368 RepID=A0A4R5CGH5_9ACTN|nr:hypothetical protein [Actinomadura rubrisoli]TDD98159.1 hypothetical protein E1298_00395 [Actinomadura rubrisoli]